MRQAALTAFVIALMPVPTLAHDYEPWEMAKGLAALLAHEDLCGLTFDRTALATLMADLVDPKDLAFVDALDYSMGQASIASERQSEAMNALECIAVENSARAYGLIE